jgi:hypothetical protein
MDTRDPRTWQDLDALSEERRTAFASRFDDKQI